MSNMMTTHSYFNGVVINHFDDNELKNIDLSIVKCSSVCPSVCPGALITVLFVCLILFFTSHQQSFSYIGTGLLGLN